MRATSAAWLETLTIEPPLPRRIIDCEAYLITSKAPRALTLITLSKTAMSVSIGVAISPPKPPQLTTPQRSRPWSALRTLSSDVKSKAARAAAGLRLERVERFTVAAAGDDVRARGDELTNRRAADAAARAGDEDRPSFQTPHDLPHSATRESQFSLATECSGCLAAEGSLRATSRRSQEPPASFETPPVNAILEPKIVSLGLWMALSFRSQ